MQRGIWARLGLCFHPTSPGARRHHIHMETHRGAVQLISYFVVICGRIGSLRSSAPSISTLRHSAFVCAFIDRQLELIGPSLDTSLDGVVVWAKF